MFDQDAEVFSSEIRFTPKTYRRGDCTEGVRGEARFCSSENVANLRAHVGDETNLSCEPHVLIGVSIGDTGDTVYSRLLGVVCDDSVGEAQRWHIV